MKDKSTYIKVCFINIPAKNFLNSFSKQRWLLWLAGIFILLFAAETGGGLLSSSFAESAENAQDSIKVAIAAAGRNGDSSVGPTATRSPYYLIFDSAGKLLEIIENPYIHTRQGSGACVNFVSMLSEKKISHIIAGAFGPRTSVLLQKAGIKRIQMKGGVRKSLESFLIKIKAG